MKRAQLMIAVISMTLLGCPSVHTMRGAEVLPSGTSEVVTHVGMNGILIAASAEAEGESDSTAGQGVLPWAAFSYRAGLGNNMDFQVKTDLGLFPELGLAYQFVGAPGSGQPAVSAYLGAKYFSAGAGDELGSVLYAPLTLLADLPLGENKVTVKGGFMLISASGGGSSTASSYPLLGVSGRVKLGGMTLMPEINYMHAGSESAASDDGSASVSVGGGLIAYGLGFSF